MSGLCEMSSGLHRHKSKIQQFYTNKVILLTGGTGFLGKILIEKILRSCPNVQKIYLLVREKNGKNGRDRLKKLLDDVVFLRLKNENPWFMEKLCVVHGDLNKPRLGLDQRIETSLKESVDIILHSAATLRFDEGLRIAISTNIAATKELCLIAEEIINLKAFVYVSTAYSNCNNPIIPERVCPSPISPEKLINLSELLEGSLLDDLTPILLGSKPNTYIFTKCAAEEVVSNFKSSLPVAIIRPSIVLATLSEPIPGWIDNIQGPTGVVVSAGAGLLRTIICNDLADANIVPVDYTANAIVALAYSVAEQHWQCSKDEEGLPIINFVSTAGNSITWGRFGDMLIRKICENPSPRLLWYPVVTRPQKHWSFAVQRALLHYLPANIVDFLTARFGHPTRLRQLYRRIDKYSKVVNYFSMRHFDFEEKNARLLWENLDPQDQELFPFNMADINWESYFTDYVRGCRQYLLKEDPNSIDWAKKRLRVLYCIHVVSKSTFFLLFLKFLLYIFNVLGRRMIKSTF